MKIKLYTEPGLNFYHIWFKDSSYYIHYYMLSGDLRISQRGIFEIPSHKLYFGENYMGLECFKQHYIQIKENL